MAFGLSKIFSSLKTNQTIRPQKVVGIDFGSSSIKVAEIEMHEGVLALSTYGELQLGPYAQVGLGGVAKLEPSKRIAALVDILRESGVATKSAVLAQPMADSFVTVMSLTAKADEDIGTRVPVEARKYIPVPLNDVTLEWSEIPQITDDKNLTREVMLAAIQNDALTRMRELMGAVQLPGQPFEIELFSTLRAASKESDTSIAVVDVGAETIKLFVSEGGYLRRMHRVRAGGAVMTEALSKALNVPFTDAENIKRNYTPAIPQAATVKTVMSSVFDRPFQEFRRVLSQHEARMGKPVDRIVLTGGGSLFHDYTAYASYMLDREVTLCNPFNKVAYPAFMEDKLKEIGPIFTTAVGAALRSFEQ